MRKTPVSPEAIPSIFFFGKTSFKTNRLKTATQTALKFTNKEDLDAVVKLIPRY
jgi:hypothetical protein